MAVPQPIKIDGRALLLPLKKHERAVLRREQKGGQFSEGAVLRGGQISVIQVAKRLDHRPAAKLLGGLPGSNLFAFISIISVPVMKGLIGNIPILNIALALQGLMVKYPVYRKCKQEQSWIY